MSTQQLNIDTAESIIPSLIRRISALEHSSVSDLPLLTETIDPDALETIITESSPPVTVSFEYAGYDVVVSATDATSGTVSIAPL